MKDWKTTVSGVVAGLAMLSKTFGLPIPDEVTNGIIAVAMFLIGFFATEATK